MIFILCVRIGKGNKKGSKYRLPATGYLHDLQDIAKRLHDCTTFPTFVLIHTPPV
jgi:hypothetical protein